jgi:thioredoxin reductase
MSRIVIIGGGLAGPAAGCYARMCGRQAIQVLVSDAGAAFTPVRF